jgi:hypothetical protein
MSKAGKAGQEIRLSDKKIELILSAAQKKQLADIKAAKEKLSSLMRRPKTPIHDVSQGKYTLSDGTANAVLDAQGRAGGPTPAEAIEIRDMKEAILALDKALTALGYERHIYTTPGVKDIDQVNYSWVSERLTLFQIDQNLIQAGISDKRSLTGDKTIKAMVKALDKAAEAVKYGK